MSSVGIPRAQGRERRYNEQIGVQQNRTNFSREAKNPETPFRTALKEDLLIGNWVLGSKRTEILYKGYGRSKSGQKDKFPTHGGVYKEPG